MTGREGGTEGGRERDTDRHIKLVATSMCGHIPSCGFDRALTQILTKDQTHNPFGVWDDAPTN